MKTGNFIIFSYLCLISLSDVFCKDTASEEFWFGANYSNYKNVAGAVPGLGLRVAFCKLVPQQDRWLNKYELQVRRNISTMEKQIVTSIDNEYYHYEDIKSNLTVLEPTVIFIYELISTDFIGIQPYGGVSYSLTILDDSSFEDISNEAGPEAYDNGFISNTWQGNNWFKRMWENSGFGCNIGFVFHVNTLLFDVRYFYPFFNVQSLGNARVNKKYVSISISVGVVIKK